LAGRTITRLPLKSHAYSSGLNLDVHYTWSKALTTLARKALIRGSPVASGSTAFTRSALRNNYHLSYGDIPHRFVATIVYDLPFGGGKRFSLNNSRVFD
jgi:hypothetical protein